MSLVHHWRAQLVAVMLAAGARAQQPVPTLFLAPDLRLDGKGLGTGAMPVVELKSVGPDGRMIVTVYGGEMRAFDSTGKSLGWKILVGMSRNSDIGWIERTGWTGSALWIADPQFQQVVPIDARGTLGKSIPYPTWVRPTWAERRKYPLFGYLDPFAVYADRSLLVRPRGPRALLDTPGFDRSIAHLLRIDADGVIQREVARFETGGAGRFTVPGDGRIEHTITAPFYDPPHWGMSADGQRFMIASPGVVPHDSGTVRVVAIGANGDTIFTRRYPSPSVRVTKAMADSALAKVQEFGSTPAAVVRAQLAPKIPLFKSFITGFIVGLDHSAWIISRPVSDTAVARDALIIDERGEPIATVRMPTGLTSFFADRAHLWGVERGGRALVRLKLQATPPPPAPTPSPPARSVKASAAKG